VADRVRKDRQQSPSKSDGEVTERLSDSSRSTPSAQTDIEQILDEIDDVLESNAEDFVRNYVQKGGQ
jgi:ubiquitin-like protein Pup